MTNAPDPFGPTDEAAVAGANAGAGSDAARDAVETEVALLDELEADLVAVETAIATIERVATDGPGGEQAAAEIRAAVSIDRFGSPAGPASH